jgi:hypothetical protein
MRKTIRCTQPSTTHTRRRSKYSWDKLTKPFLPRKKHWSRQTTKANYRKRLPYLKTPICRSVRQLKRSSLTTRQLLKAKKPRWKKSTTPSTRTLRLKFRISASYLNPDVRNSKNRLTTSKRIMKLWRPLRKHIRRR